MSNRWFEDREWVLLEMRGEDRVDFLTRLTTNILPSSESPLIHNFFLSVNARIQAEFWVSARSDHLALLTPEKQAESLRACIDRYHFGEKISLTQPAGKLFIVEGPDQETRQSATATFEPDPRHGGDCVWCFVSEERLEDFQSLLGEALEFEELERMRIQSGRLRFPVDYDDESLFVEVAQQGDFSELKGCYPGQEIVARVLHRGRLNRHLRGFHSEQTVPTGWSLKVDGKEVAGVRSIVPDGQGGSIGYLMVRREYGEAGSSLVGVGFDGTECTLTVTPRAGEVLTGEEE